MPSSADAGSAVAAVARAIVAATAGIDVPTILIDGRSGAGKSTLASAVAAQMAPGVQVVALDDIYPGWDGLAAGADAACRDILAPRRRGLPGAWRRWDWTDGAPAERHAVDPHRPLVIEGAGLLTPTSASLVDVSVWVECPTAVRRRRALDRDGETYRPHWQRWARQERTHVHRHRPAALATIVAEIP